MSQETKPTQLEPAVASDLLGLVAYGDDAIVSRTLVKGDAGSITLFAFDAGQGLSEHTAPFDATVQMLEGEGEVTIGGKTIKLAAGQIVIMPANVPHAVQAPARFKMLLTMLRG